MKSHPIREKSRRESLLAQNFTFSFLEGPTQNTECSLEAMLVQPRGRGFSEPDGPERTLETPKSRLGDAHSL